MLPTFPFSLTTYFGIRLTPLSPRCEWDVKVGNERKARLLAQAEEDHLDRRRGPYLYDALYGTNHMGHFPFVPTTDDLRNWDKAGAQ